MRFRYVVLFVLCAFLLPCAAVAAASPSSVQQQQGASAQNSLTPLQRLEVMRSRLETMRRTLNTAIAGLNAKDKGGKDASPDDAATRLRGLEKEVNSILSEVTDLRGKQERAEKYDTSSLDKLETSVTDIGERVDAAMQATAGARRAAGSATATSGGSNGKKKGGGSIFGRLIGRGGGGGDDKYGELTGTVAPGRDRTLFEEATKEARKDHYETARSLYGVIINTYPESPYLPLAKLAIADTFYLEGTTGALVQASQYYQDWLTFFPTDPLADDVMLKLAEVEMRKMGLPDRDVSSARKAEQRLKVLLQQFPNTSLRTEAEIRLREVQENLAMHDFMVGNQYFNRFFRGVANNPKGAQSRYLDVVKKYPNFSYMDEVLFRLGVTYVQEEEPDEAAKYFQRLVREHPNSELADKAREQLEAIGMQVPAPDPERAKLPPPERPGTFEKFKLELLGSPARTIDKNGILISTSDKTRDLIQEAIDNGGQLPHTVPTAPVQRSRPARTLVPATTPAPRPATTPASGTNQTPAANNTGGVSIQPTQPGAPASGDDPTRPATEQTPANKPATPAPSTTKP